MDGLDRKDNHADPQWAGARRKSCVPTLVMEAQKRVSDSHKVFLCILHNIQSICAELKELLA